MKANKSPQPDDASLIEQIHVGDAKAFEQLFDRYESAVFRFCMVMLGDQDAAQDIHQETFFRFYQTCRQSKEVRSVYGWLISAARSRCHNYLRDQKRHAQLARKHHQESVLRPDYLNNMDIEDHIQQALLQIPAHYREVLSLYEVEGYSYKEIAEILDIDFHQIKNRIYQAKQSLQRILSPILNESDAHHK
ncbi:MAG: RNA polymerase sigma factor [Ignavibacteriae bacterium]|nr:RNA polymerase sigma factor [Ignavibacteriota bacterium]MCB9215247.1 RNA polymerase sigma factor [Ignavibacteria bacterium]